jgi:hypothetical protein
VRLLWSLSRWLVSADCAGQEVSSEPRLPCRLSHSPRVQGSPVASLSNFGSKVVHYTSRVLQLQHLKDTPDMRPS